MSNTCVSVLSTTHVDWCLEYSGNYRPGAVSVVPLGDLVGPGDLNHRSGDLKHRSGDL